VRTDSRKCTPEAGCGGFFVTEANKSLTACADSSEAECYVDDIDFGPTLIADSITDKHEARIRAGEVLIVRGEVEAATAQDAFPVLKASEIWLPQSEGTAEGVYVLAKENGITCVTQPCDNITEIRLNSSRKANISGIDFEASGADEALVANALDKLGRNDGIIVVGERVTESGALGGKLRTATQFYTRAPVPLK
jgi:hypothetical protein